MTRNTSSYHDGDSQGLFIFFQQLFRLQFIEGFMSVKKSKFVIRIEDNEKKLVKKFH